MIHTKWSKNILDVLLLTGGGESGKAEKEQENTKLKSATFTYKGTNYSNQNLLDIGKTSNVAASMMTAANNHISNSDHGDTLSESEFKDYQNASDQQIYTDQNSAENGATTAASNKKTELLNTIKAGVEQVWLKNNELQWHNLINDEVFTPNPEVSSRTNPVVWYASQYNDTTHKYEYIKKTATVGVALDSYFNNMRGWTFSAEKQRVYDYPKFSYIGLFTEMPLSDGSNYQEPPSNSTYQRMDLLNDVILGRGCLSDPKPHVGGGAETTNDNVQILFPEAYFTDDSTAWGKIKGFGVFETDEQDGTPPIFWDKLANDKELEIESGYVPLFRTGDFKVIL